MPNNLGTDIEGALRQPVRDLLRALNNGARLEAANEPARELLNKLKSESVAALAWNDLVRVAGNPSQTWARYCGRRNTFLSIATTNFHELGSLSTASMAAGVLANDSFDIERVRSLTGRTDHLASSGNLSKAERMQLCSELWANRGRKGRNVVWLVFEFAPMHMPYLTVPPVTLYDAREFVQSIEDPNRGSIELGSEITPRYQDLEEWLPDAELGNALARVDLGHSPVSTAVEDAIRIVESLIQVKVGHRKIGWRRIPRKAVQITDDTLFQITDRRPTRHAPSGWRSSPCASILKEESKSRYLRFSEDLETALMTMGALEHDSLDPVQRRVMARVEIIEQCRLVTGGGKEWYDLAAELRDGWIVSQFLTYVINVPAYVSKSNLDSLGLGEAIRDQIVEILATFESSDEDGHYVHLEEIVQSSELLCDLLPKAWLPRQELANAVQLLLPNQRGEAYANLSCDFDLLLERSRRCRNAIAHGWPVSARAAESALPLLTYLARTLTYIRTSAERNNVSAAFELQHFVIRTSGTLEKMAAGNFRPALSGA